MKWLLSSANIVLALAYQSAIAHILPGRCDRGKIAKCVCQWLVQVIMLREMSLGQHPINYVVY
jgi:hypothetical protein